MLIKLHGLSVECGHLVGEHQVVDVEGVGVFSFNGTLDLLKKFGKGSKHYPERIVHSTHAFAPFTPVHSRRVAPAADPCLPLACTRPIHWLPCCAQPYCEQRCVCATCAVDDINNTKLAMFIWPAIAPWIPKHTAAKLRVCGRDYKDMLLRQIAKSELPVVMGGDSNDARWDYMSMSV